MMKKKKEIMAIVRIPRTHQFFHLHAGVEVGVRVCVISGGVRVCDAPRLGSSQAYLEESPDRALFRTSGVSSDGPDPSGTPESTLESLSDAPSFCSLSEPWTDRQTGRHTHS